jgi:hypothetical protein
MTSRTALLLLTALGASFAEAQRRPPSDSLPRELVTALLGGTMGSRSINVQTGLADDSLPPTLFRDALILGYADLRSSVMTVAYFPYTPQETLDTIQARLVALGWRNVNRPAGPDRGFISSFSDMGPPTLCNNRSVLVPNVQQRTINRTLTVLSRQMSPGAAEYLCNERSVMRERMRGPLSDTPVPALPAPDGMHATSSSMSGGSPDADRAVEMSTSLTGDTRLADIAQHYATLFERANWIKVDEVDAKSISVTSFEITDSLRTRWHLMLIVDNPIPGAADARLKLRRQR